MPKSEEEKEIEEIMGIAGKAVVGMVKKFCSDKELPKVLAKFVKRYFDALVAEGFTKEQALEIVTKIQFPSAPAKTA